MGFNTFAILGVLIAITGVKTAREIIRNRRAMFDDVFTDSDRRLIMLTAFYFLVPISVALHEGGHAIVAKYFHAQIVDFGFYFFAGFVSYQGYLSATQQILIAVAGPLVNVILAAIALGFLTLKRPLYHAPVNELLFQFIVLSLANTLIFYPLLDLATGMNGDYHQIYFGGVRWLAILIGIVHAGILIGAYAASKSHHVSAYLGRLTGLPPDVHRGLMGGLRYADQPPRNQPASPAQRLMAAAAERVASGWDAKVQIATDRRPSATTVALQWNRAGAERVVFLSAAANGPVVIVGVANAGGSTAQRIELNRWPALPSEDELAMSLRIGMERVDALAGQSDRAFAPA